MKFFRTLYLNNLFFAGLTLLVMLFIVGYFGEFFLAVAKVSAIAFLVALAGDFLLLYRKGMLFFARRETPDKLSNGDDNEFKIFLENHFPYTVTAGIIDEIPIQFQVRNFFHQVKIPAGQNHVLNYFLKPLKRGEYSFGNLYVYISSPIGLIKRRFSFDSEKTVPVYPSFIQMHKYELLAISSRLTEGGIKRIRKLGHSMEFEKIREYVVGDDQRMINWKATARKGSLMTNQFQDEKSQQVYCIIDKGRTMQMPFEGLSLLDYSINASLVISNVAIKKQDKAGLVTFSDKQGSLLKATRSSGQLKVILEILYNQKTNYLEPDFEKLYSTLYRNLNQRALLFLFSNFGSVNALQRQLPYLRKIAKNHLLVVIFFENTELKELIENQAGNIEQIYIKTIAEQFAFEKKQMVRELESYGIHSILTSPKNLSVNAINKYLEVKSRRLL